jgi:hypothetical protein
MAPKHPYYPLNAKIVGYHPMVLNMGYILAVFGGSMALVAILTWYLSGEFTESTVLLSRKAMILSQMLPISLNNHSLPDALQANTSV